MEELKGSEDYLFDSLETLYDIQPVMLTTSCGASTFTHVLKSPTTPDNDRADRPNDIRIEISTPDTTPANWGLHASAIWVSSTHLADHLEQLELENYMRIKQTEAQADRVVRVIELGASAGLPSISIAKLYSACDEIQIMATDYEDELLMQTLSENISRNGVAHRCRPLPYSWGTDPSPLLEACQGNGFDVVIATDTLWNPDLHGIFIDSLQLTLRKCCDSRVHLVVGLHTGRYTIQSFLDKVHEAGFDLESIVERQTMGLVTREWVVYRDEEDEKERRKWVIWIQLKWKIT